MSEEKGLVQHLCELEQSLLVAGVRKSGRVAELLDDEFVEFGSSGRTYIKAEIVALLRSEVPVDITAREFKVKILGRDAALVTYRACRHSVPPVHTLRSSIWQLEKGRWRMVFHQGTLAAAPE